MTKSTKPLFVPLNSAPYESFEDGSKTFELRMGPKRWNENTVYSGRAVVLSKGYGKNNRISGIVGSVFISPSIPQIMEIRPNLWRSIMPNASGLYEACQLAEKLYTRYGEFIAFEFIPPKGDR